LVIACEVERQVRGETQCAAIIGAVRQALAEEHELEADSVLLLRMASLPRTTSGKIRRHACRTAFAAGELDLVGASIRPTFEAARPPSSGSEPGPAPAPGPRDAGQVEAWLAARLAGALGVDPATIDRRQPFAQLGLGSVRAVALAGELQEWLGRP